MAINRITTQSISDGTITAAKVASDMATQAELDTKLNLSGGAMTGAITTNSTFDGIDIATRDAVLTSTTTTAGAALPKAGGTMTGNLNMGANEIILADNGIIQMGTGDDFNIYHDGADSIIKDKGTGNLALRTNGNFYVVNEASSEVLIRADVNGSVDLYYDNSKKIETTSGGVTVTGTISATATATLLIINSAGSTVKTINGIG